ncbi:hypothetical protein Q5752_002947 [Cryptotrichosporon argae]
MPRLSASTATSPLHQAADSLLASAAEPTHLDAHREAFFARALRDVTANADGALGLDPGNPVAVRDEMEAQKDYFRRLKFTYLEQEAKRNFLYAITGDEPPSVSQGENEALEASNADKKAALKTAKEAIAADVDAAFALARTNAVAQEELGKKVAEVAAAQKEIREMELELARIKAAHPPEDRLTTDRANEVLEQQTAEIERLTEASGVQGARVDALRDDVGRTHKENGRLAREREREEARAREVREGREAGDTRVDELCGWYTSSIAFYRSLLGIKDVRAVSDAELHLTYAAGAAGSGAGADAGDVELALVFDAGRRFENAWLIGTDANVDEAVSTAVANNDVPGLVADVLVRLRPMA